MRFVPGLAARNAAQFANERIEFRQLDVVTDPLPEGDLCIVRQVFQHLSNRDVATVLRKAKQYPLLVVTDEQVVGDLRTGISTLCRIMVRAGFLDKG